MRTMAIIADGCFRSVGLGARMHAGFVRLDRPGGSEQVLLGKLRIGVAAAAGGGQVLAVDWRIGRGRLDDPVGRTVASGTIRGVRIAVLAGTSVHARGEFIHLAGVATGAELSATSGGNCYLVRVAVATHTGFGTVRFTQRGMSVVRQLPRDFAMTRKARGGRDLGRVRLLGRSGMTVHAVEVLVNTVRERIRPHSDRFALRVRQARGGSMTDKAVVRGFEGAWPREEADE